VSVSYNSDGVQLVERVKNGRFKPYNAPMLDKPLTRVQALDLALLLIKAVQS
jgi:hypothetical protein